MHGSGGRLAGADGHGHLVEIARADFALVACGGVATGFGCKFPLLQFRIGVHATITIAISQVEHRHVERVEARECYELEFVTHRTQFTLEFFDRRIVQLLFPVEGGRAIIGQQFAGVLLVHGFGEFFRIIQIRMRGFPPQQVSNVGIGESTRDAVVQA